MFGQRCCRVSWIVYVRIIFLEIRFVLGICRRFGVRIQAERIRRARRPGDGGPQAAWTSSSSRAPAERKAGEGMPSLPRELERAAPRGCASDSDDGAGSSNGSIHDGTSEGQRGFSGIEDGWGP